MTVRGGDGGASPVWGSCRDAGATRRTGRGDDESGGAVAPALLREAVGRWAGSSACGHGSTASGGQRRVTRRAAAKRSLYRYKGERAVVPVELRAGIYAVPRTHAPVAKKATLKTMLSAEFGTVLGRRPELHVVTVADGAHDNWRYLDALAPDATAVVDFYHAAEQLKSALDARYGENDAKGGGPVPQAASYPARRPRWRREGDSCACLSVQTLSSPKGRIGEVLRYFRRHRHRMRYAQTQARHLPVGSGVVYAVCKTLVTQRLKRSGMRRRHAGGQAILTVRSLWQSSRFGHTWALLSETYRREVMALGNVVALPHTRAA